MDGTGGTDATDLGKAEASSGISPVPPTIPLRYVSFFTGASWIVWDDWEHLRVADYYTYGPAAAAEADRLNGQLWRLAVSTIQEHHCG